MRIKFFFAVFCLGLSVSNVDAQTWKFLSNEFSFGLGSSSFLGDLGGANKIGSKNLGSLRDIDFQSNKIAIGIGYRKFLSPFLSGKASLFFGQVSGNDALTEEIYRKNRNLHFRSSIIELSVQFEYFPFSEYFGHIYRSNGVVGKNINNFSPFVFLGIGGFFYNPKANYQGDWVKLRPLKTEGVDYGNFSLAIPMGIGIKYAIDRQWNIAFELGIRMTTTDYIDDVSSIYIDQSGQSEIVQYLSNPSLNKDENPSWTQPGEQRGGVQSNDSYTFAILSVTYKLLIRKRLNLPKF